MSEKQNPNIDDSRAHEHDASAAKSADPRKSQQFHDSDGEFINNRSRPDTLSLAEQISRELDKGENVGDQLVTDPSEQTRLIELQKMSMPELLEVAEVVELGDISGVKRQELIFRILKNLVKTSGLMYGEGTLEILPDGFGFLRSPDYHYLSCPDDIYVSPSQIRRFNLRTGVSVAGQIRPPKENERYFALLRVETVNRVDPSENIARVHFDDLTPLHPHQRIVMEHDSSEVCTRIVDMITPIGFGQRGLIVSPPRAGKTILLQQMARAVLKNYPQT